MNANPSVFGLTGLLLGVMEVGAVLDALERGSSSGCDKTEGVFSSVAICSSDSTTTSSATHFSSFLQLFQRILNAVYATGQANTKMYKGNTASNQQGLTQ